MKDLEKFAKRLIGKTEMEDGLKRLDKLTQEEGLMATAQMLKVTQTVTVINERVEEVIAGA